MPGDLLAIEILDLGALEGDEVRICLFMCRATNGHFIFMAPCMVACTLAVLACVRLQSPAVAGKFAGLCHRHTYGWLDAWLVLKPSICSVCCSGASLGALTVRTEAPSWLVSTLLLLADVDMPQNTHSSSDHTHAACRPLPQCLQGNMAV